MERVQRIDDEELRRETFAQCKRALIKQAMDLSILCDCDIQVFIYSAKVTSGGESVVTTQFSSGDTETLLAHLRKNPAAPAECFGIHGNCSSYTQVLSRSDGVHKTDKGRHARAQQDILLISSHPPYTGCPPKWRRKWAAACARTGSR